MMTFVVRMIFNRRGKIECSCSSVKVLKEGWKRRDCPDRLLDYSCLGKAEEVRQGMEKICSPLPIAGGGNWRSYARQTGSQIIYYSIVSRELPRIAMRCDVTRRDEVRWGGMRDGSSSVIFHGAIDDNAIRGSSKRCRRNFCSVRKFHRGVSRERTSEFRNNEKREI